MADRSWQLTAGRWIRPLAWVGGLIPLILLVTGAFTGGLGADPIDYVTLRTGFATLLMLMLTLAVSPVRRLTGWNWLAPARRTLGLCAFLYVCLHLLTYMVDQGFAWSYILEDIAERPYVTAGFTAFLLLVPLALTSTKASIRRLGKRWQKLHRLIYVAAGLGVLHFIWLVKSDLREPLIFAAVFALLMALRLPALAGGRGKKAKKQPPATRRAAVES
ncbi:protein-methionine-sulfoxide reductase heme-binding subunit MsrQ [Longimicrobium sp.]|uniref:sulfite oxidase heme-binding subunit YedZ n=1 Tax=Longimicrobium sp. TaxID=2029185 RepID=UPI002E328BB5|nr:protein-methionine-sulfoxide reductase heme-binding subunit MsrQ [Longimicrobium sp.]HEX6039258.1 protein-methionine-sulfoxide reductase heme-binding subunit MsrQ [Longimicrobium sp.]